MTMTDSPQSLRIEKLVGQNMAGLRAARHWSQADFGKAIGELLGKAWTRQAVSNAEMGKRTFTVADLVAIAYVYETSPAALMTLQPASHVASIVIGNVSIPRKDLENPTWQHESTSAALGDVLKVLSSMGSRLDQVVDLAYELERDASALTAAGLVLQGRIRLEEKGVAIPGDYGYE
ncbi:helix-turn-helix transcriptional regulator [Agromyces sp. NPDC058104]|uniref:helix-turn-helix transcriptional regulator n=1 Tax=Agromyces sp. NPDC058104 TaxID=3346342 RepID=UPI0036DCFF94